MATSQGRYEKINFTVTGEEMKRLKELCVNSNTEHGRTDSVHSFCRRTIFEVTGISSSTEGTRTVKVKGGIE